MAEKVIVNGKEVKPAKKVNVEKPPEGKPRMGRRQIRELLKKKQEELRK